MGDYPRAVRNATVQCVPCNAPAVQTVEGDYVCVECGARPVKATTSAHPVDGASERPTASD